MPGIILNNFWMQLEKEKAVALREQLGNFMDIAIHSNGSYFGLIRTFHFPCCVRPRIANVRLDKALDFANDKPPEEWKFQIFMSMPEPADLVSGEDSSARRFKIVKHFGMTFVAPFSQATEWFAEDTFISPDHYGTWETKKWDHRGGKVILAGDSAHSMTPRKLSPGSTQINRPHSESLTIHRPCSGLQPLPTRCSQHYHRPEEDPCWEEQLGGLC